MSPEAIDLIADAVTSRVVARLDARSSEVGWLDAKSAARYAGCSVNALHKAMGTRDVKFSQDTPGGKAWFRREWIDTWRLG